MNAPVRLILGGILLLLMYAIFILPALAEMFIFNTKRGHIISFLRRCEYRLIDTQVKNV